MTEAPTSQIEYTPISSHPNAQNDRIIAWSFFVPDGELRVGTEEHWREIMALPPEEKRFASKELVLQGIRDLPDVENVIAILHQLPREFVGQYIERDDEILPAEAEEVAAMEEEHLRAA